MAKIDVKARREQLWATIGTGDGFVIAGGVIQKPDWSPMETIDDDGWKKYIAWYGYLAAIWRKKHGK